VINRFPQFHIDELQLHSLIEHFVINPPLNKIADQALPFLLIQPSFSGRILQGQTRITSISKVRPGKLVDDKKAADSSMNSLRRKTLRYV
jgi:hypothetical protein